VQKWGGFWRLKEGKSLERKRRKRKRKKRREEDSVLKLRVMSQND
jgi:hypothetical protein